VAAELENLGFRTWIVERAFDQDFHPVIDADPAMVLHTFSGADPATAFPEDPRSPRPLGDA
jgi:hypothetical protein